MYAYTSLWAPMFALADPATPIAQMREEFEAILAHSPMPPTWNWNA